MPFFGHFVTEGGEGACISSSVSLQAFLGTEVVKAALNLTGSALAAITGAAYSCSNRT